MQPAHAGVAGHRLASDLDKVILARKRNGSAHDRMLGRCRNGRSATLRKGNGLGRMTSDQPGTQQEHAPENPARRQVAA